jgi:uncharacterized YccA/Bax inhibitor family protein
VQTKNPVMRKYADFREPGSVLGQSTEPAPGMVTAAPGQRVVTLDDVVMKSAMMLAVLMVGAFFGWSIAPTNPGIAFLAMGIGFVLGLVNIFKKEVSPPLVLAYAAAQGVFLGAISFIFQNAFAAQGTNLVGNTVMATVIAFAVMLTLYKTGIVKVNAKFIKIMMVALISYLIIAVISFISSFAGVGGGWGFYGVGGIGILLVLVGVGLATFSLALDFEAINQAVDMNLPERESWKLAFGLILTLVWLYIEFLRLFAILAANRD